MPAPQSFNKILLTTSNESEKNITLQEISGQLYINDHLVITSANIGSLSNITVIESDVTTLQTDLTTLDTSVSTLQSEVSTLQASSGTSVLTNSSSVSFDGTNDQARTFSAFESMFQSSFSISGWGKLNNTSGLKFWFGVNVSGTSRYQLYFSGSTLYSFIQSGGTSGDTLNSNSSSASFTDWFHVCVTYEQSGANLIQKMYINGSFVDSGTTSTDLSNWSNTSQDMLIGSRNTTGQYVWNGLMDELAFFDSALSSSDVTAIYNSGSPTDLTNLNPIHWWRMGDDDSSTGTTITDQGSGSADLALTNGPTFSTNIPEEEEVFSNTYSLSLDGANDYLSISASSYSISGNKSFSAWLKPTSGSYHYLWGYGTNLYALYFDSSAVSIRMWPSGQGGGSGRTYQRMVSPVSLTNGSWYNITITGDGTTLKLYVNGQSAASTYTDNDDWYFETALRAGASGTSFSGLVDEFAFFNSTLSSSEVSAIYGSGEPSSLSDYNPHLWWRMGDNDGGTGTTVTDQGSGSNDATLTNGPTFSTTIPS
jgi:uncharacterized protein YaiE (UPF0345 family)